jgi:hypothetical protein
MSKSYRAQIVGEIMGALDAVDDEHGAWPPATLVEYAERVAQLMATLSTIPEEAAR